MRETPGSSCGAVKWVRRSRGVLGKGTESFTTVPEVCGAATAPGSDLCPRHLAAAARMEAKLTAKRERNSR